MRRLYGDIIMSDDYRREMAEDIPNQQAFRPAWPAGRAGYRHRLASDDESFIPSQVLNCSGGPS